LRVQNDDRWLPLFEQLSKITLKVHDVSQAHTIIASLRYENMELRHEAIKNAFSKTFDWIYSPPGDSQLNVNLVDWLRSGDGVYWVTGKPGRFYT
jgi:hypothetical protein